MNRKIEVKIKEYEQRLCQAMLKSDVSGLDKLLSPGLIFTNHLGMILTKEDDLKAHETGVLKIFSINLSDQKIITHGDVVIVSVSANILGCFAEDKSENDFRFTRVWRKQSDGNWQIIAGHSSIVN